MPAALLLDSNTRSRARARGPKIASGIFFRATETRARKLRCKSLESRRVARPAATKTVSGVRYYGRRYYDPRQGGFVGRDPIEEQGGLNLYGFCGNNGVNRWDVLGQYGDGEIIMMDGGAGAANNMFGQMQANIQAWIDSRRAGTAFDNNALDNGNTRLDQTMALQLQQTQSLAYINSLLAGGSSVAVSLGGRTFILSPGGGAISGGAMGGVIIGPIVNLGVVDDTGSNVPERLSPWESYVSQRAYDAQNGSRPVFIPWSPALGAAGSFGRLIQSGLNAGADTVATAQAVQGAVAVGRAGLSFVRGLGAVENGVAQIGTKLEYLFGNATGSAHNIARSQAMANELARIGLADSAAARAYVTQQIERSFLQQGIEQTKGRILRETVLIGPEMGAVKLQTVWDGNRLITFFVKPGGG